MTLVDMLSGLWPAVATFVVLPAVATFMFHWPILKKHVPVAFITMAQGVPDRLATWTNKLTTSLNPYLEITISKYGGSDFFENLEAYLSEACTLRGRKLKVEFGRDSKKLIQVAIGDNEEFTDTYAGATIWWYASLKTQKANVIITGGDDERRYRYYRLVFHRRHRELVVHSYLPHVQNEGRAVTVRNRQRRLFTNNPISSSKIWRHVPLEHPATFNTLAMDPDKKKAIMDDLTAFRNAKNYYAKVGKAWKRGYLLYGPPGTGKSTMIAAMANFLDYDVYNVDLTAVKNNTELRELFFETTGKSIIVIEDMDCSVDLTGKRKDKKKTTDIIDDQQSNNTSKMLPIQPEMDDGNKVTLPGLLNFMDGLWWACGGERIIIVTTNHVDKLDPALIRRGRMDKHIEMSYCTFEAFKVLANNYLNITEHELFGEIRQLLQETDMTPADVAENLIPMSNNNDDDDVDACLVSLVEALNNKAKEDALALIKLAKEESELAQVNYAREEDGKDWMIRRTSSESKKPLLPVSIAGVQNPIIPDYCTGSSPESESLQRMTRAESGTDKTTKSSQPPLQTDRGEWILGTSAWVHHTFNLRLLHDLTTRNLQEVADELTSWELDEEDCYQLPVLGHGSVRTERFRVPEVRYIQGESRNVISVAQLARLHGLITVFEPTFGYVRDSSTGQEVGRAHLSNGAYVLDYLLIDQENGKEEEERPNGAGGGGETGKVGERGVNGGGGVTGGTGDGGTARGEGGAGGAAAGGAGDDGGGRKGKGEGSGGGGDDEDTKYKEEDDEEEEEEEEEEENESTYTQNNMFGLPKFYRPNTTVGVFPTSIDGLRRTKAFYVDSGAGHHITWNGNVLFPYPQHLNINTTIQSITGVSGDSLAVGGIGYIVSAGGSLDRVLFVPKSAANLVSVSQLSRDYSVRVEFYIERIWITRIATGERIGHGYLMGRHYVLDRFEAERLVQQNAVC